MVNFNSRDKSILDIFASTKPHLFKQPFKIFPLGKSDHCGLLVNSFSRCEISASFTKVKVRDYCLSNQARFLSYVVNLDWLSLLSSASIDNCINNFNDNVFNLIESCFPIKVVRMRSDDPPWMSASLKILFDKMDRAHFKNYGQFLVLRDTFQRKMKSAKCMFASSLFRKANTSKKFWKVVKQLGKANVDKKDISDDVAVCLNDKFANSFVPPDLDDFDLTDVSFSYRSCSGCIISVSEFEVFHALIRIRSSSCGPDNISGLILKKNCP